MSTSVQQIEYLIVVKDAFVQVQARASETSTQTDLTVEDMDMLLSQALILRTRAPEKEAKTLVTYDTELMKMKDAA